jgi:hypothetical protein
MIEFRSYREFVQTGCFTVALLCGTVLFGCVPDAARRGQAGNERSAPERPALDLSGDAPWPAPYAADPVWRRAAAGDDFDRARLGRSEGATSLLAALSLGGSLGRTALAALPFAPDRRQVLGSLCELALGPAPPTSSWLLGAIYEALAEAPRTEEAVDPAADARCSSNLRQLSERSGMSPEDRDRALGAISLLAKR